MRSLWGSQSNTLDSRTMERLAKTFPLPVWVIDESKDRFTWVSSGTIWLTKLSPEELLSTPARQYLEKHFSPSETLLKLIREKASQAEVSITYIAGATTAQMLGYWIELQPGLYALILQDVTELRKVQDELVQYVEELRQQLDTLTELKESLQRANEELAASREQLRLLAAVAAYTDNAVIITDAKGQILWVNRGFERISGYTLEEAKGKVPGKLLQGPETDPVTVARIRDKLRTKEPFTEEILNYTKYGRPYWLRLYITPLTNELNEVTHFMAIEMDITEEKRKMELMKQQIEDIKQAQIYASRIFKRFLPSPTLLKNYFSDVEIWSQPLQELSGDFYFFSPQEGEVILALGDSTGHGAAAALISTYALTSLWQSTRAGIKSLLELYQDLLEGITLNVEEQRYKEGFELALLRYDSATKRLEFVGARRSLWIFREGQFYELRGSRSDISPTTSRDFSPDLQVFHLQGKDRLYLFSDGVSDQLSADGKKFSSQRLRNFLQLNQYLTLNEQVSLLKQALNQWRGQNSQTDDILFLALEV
ncbi:MAG: SpoIIE family protein phosphatase [Bacteroidia bacterium]|nr:SpoIIE family protein phosphatase [Bacteroidia bacterium]MDW8134569.1 SpoIIE family protein phosphatase [Bacteroidia bacterium]